MQVFDEITGRFRSVAACRQAVVGHLPGQLIIGWVDKKAACTDTLFFNSVIRGFDKCPAVVEKIQDLLVFSNKDGYYMSRVDVPEDILIRCVYTKGTGAFPYHFDKKYEACENFEKFEGKQKVLNPDSVHCLSNYLNYSFGLEFETSQGYVPEDICFRDGLIPLRDGSISGIEYSTVVMSGNNGITLLEQQVESLKKYTDFNKECSLHIHFGGFPLDSEKLFNLYTLCKWLEKDLSEIVPKYTFNTSAYKANGKDYCKKLPTYRNFNQMYEHLVGRKFFNDFTQPHPNDIIRAAKWKIPTRYYFVNFINALCYNVNKTIEFRFLRPTYNFQKITLWLYILNAILYYSENYMGESSRRVDLLTVIRKVYPRAIAERVILGLYKLKAVVVNQRNNGDFIGHDIYIEEEVFSEDLGI